MAYDSEPRADRRALEEFETSSLCPDTIKRYRSIFAERKPRSPWVADGDEDFLYHVGALAKGADGRVHPTRAGLLAFGYEYEITNLLPQYLLDYREETSPDLRWDDRVVSQDGDWSGNLIDFYLTVTSRLLGRFKSPFRTDRTGTRHGAENPVTEAVNEAITNALVHAYYGGASAVTVILRPELLEVTNPGTLLVDRDVAIAGGTSETRNPTLMRLFSFIGASDRAGSGVQEIWETWPSEFGSEPELAEIHSPSASVRLNLPLSAAMAPARPPFSDAVLDAVRKSPEGLTSRDVQDRFGVSDRVAQKRLRGLLAPGLGVERVREGRAWRYRVSP